MLSDYNYNGWGYAVLPAGIGHIKDPCRIILSIYQGEIKTCYISGPDGQVLFTGKEALALITRLNTLNWTLKDYEDPETPAPSHPAIHPPTNERITRPLPALRFPPRSEASNADPRITRQLPALRPAQSTSPMVIRTREYPFSEVASWPRKWRQVYMLANGQTSRDKVASMLQLTPQEMNHLLHTMISQGIITLRQPE